MSGYTKLFATIITSSIWQEDLETKVVWITLLALKNKDGIAETTLPGLAHLSGVSLDKTEKIIEKFQNPDKYSRSADYEGRRIQLVDGGFLLLNHEKYRQLLSNEERREYYRRKQAEHRKKKKNQDLSNNCQ